MDRKLHSVVLRGVSFTLKTDEDPHYIDQLVSYLERRIEETESKMASPEPVKLLLLVGLLLTDELMKERMERGRSSSLSTEEGREVERIALKLIDDIDRYLKG